MVFIMILYNLNVLIFEQFFIVLKFPKNLKLFNYDFLSDP